MPYGKVSQDAQGHARLEHDSLGEMAVPAHAYYGIHTMRALENFPISSVPIGVISDLLRAFAIVKRAAARANRDLELMDPVKADVIERVCERSGACWPRWRICATPSRKKRSSFARS
jgi:aspartate ammonia-lyase